MATGSSEEEFDGTLNFKMSATIKILESKINLKLKVDIVTSK
jgi:hypothetical protein